MDGTSLVIRLQRSPYGASTPMEGAVHSIIPGKRASER
jgi:hypothetical protein